jgi:hypothetical protein
MLNSFLRLFGSSQNFVLIIDLPPPVSPPSSPILPLLPPLLPPPLLSLTLSAFVAENRVNYKNLKEKLHLLINIA